MKKEYTRWISFLLAAVLVLGLLPQLSVAASAEGAELVPLYQSITVLPGQLDSNTDGEIIENEIYGYVVGYELKKGHTLSISNTDYVFSVRKLSGGNYSTMLKQATVDSYTATEDMTVGMLIRKPDKSALTAEELASIVIYDSQYGMIGVEGYSHRFTVEAETIDGGTATTRAAIFLPPNYSESGTPTRLIIMTNGQNGHLRDNQWNANTADDVAVMKHYMEANYAVLVVDNTAGRTSNTSDLGCPQLVDSYFKAYEYVQEHLNVEELFSLHSRSNGTFAAVRIMREHPELVKCALMTGAQFSMKVKFSQNPSFIANRFGFDDTTGATYEADKIVGYDIYTDVDGTEYTLPPTFWMLSESDATTTALSTIEKVRAHGNDVTTATYTDTDHSGVCRLNTEQCWADALAYLEAHQESTAEHRFCAWTVTKAATCEESGEMRRVCADCDYYETMELSQSGHISGENEEVCIFCGAVLLDPLSQEIPVIKGQFSDSTGVWVDSNIYGCVIGYELKKGHTLSISDENYVFAVRQLVGGSYGTMVKEATVDSFTATEDMTVAIRVRKPDKSALTAEELASIVLYDTQYSMLDVEGYGQRFTVEAETIDGGTATTRANIYLPASYSADGEPTKLIVMTNGYSAYLTHSTWNGNTAENVGVIRNYLDAGYAVLVVDNTAGRTSQTPDLGCPQLVSSYFKAYEYVQAHFNVEEKFSLHSRSFGTFAAVRIMLERPELVNCAVMTGPRVSLKSAWSAVDKSFVANRFGFADTTGATYEADVLAGHDPYTDVDGDSYELPPTFWMMASGDSTTEPVEYIEKLTAHGNDVTSKTYSSISHTGICTLNTDETFADALAFLEGHQTHTHTYTDTTTAPTCTEQGYTTHTCSACGDSYVDSYVDALGHSYVGGVCSVCGNSVLGSSWIAPDFADGDYTMVVIPDQQNLVGYHSETYYAMMQWIADNQQTLNIQAVMNMGDMVNSNTDAEWTVSETGTDILEAAGIPWMPMMGNHDDSTWFNKYYDYATYGTDQSWFGGSYEAGELDHTYWFVTVGEREYMILSLGWAPSWDVLEWARGIVEEYADKNVILTCHAYMNKDGTLLDSGDSLCVSSFLSGYPDGDDVWAAFKGYENVVLAMGGHIHSADVVTWVDQNGIGRDVTSLLFDRQDDDIKNRYGMIALLTFHSDSDTVDINWYSTRYDALYKEKNQFSVTVPHLCDHVFETSTAEPTCTQPGGTVHTCTICGGSYTEGETPALEHNYETVVVEPTCTQKGYTELVCTRCGDSHIEVTAVDITDQFDAWTVGGPVGFATGDGFDENSAVGTNSNLQYSDYVSIKGYDSLTLTVCARKGNTATGGYAFYDENYAFISEGASARNGNGADAEGTVIHDITIPEGAKYIRVTYWSSNSTYSSYPFSCVAYQDSYVDATGHTPGEAVRENEGEHGSYDLVTYCETCGEELSREHDDGYLPGDINGDGSVNNKDLTRLFQYLSGYDVEVVADALDVNGDGNVNNKDVTRLFQYLSGWDTEIN